MLIPKVFWMVFDDIVLFTNLRSLSDSFDTHNVTFPIAGCDPTREALGAESEVVVHL